MCVLFEVLYIKVVLLILPSQKILGNLCREKITFGREKIFIIFHNRSNKNNKDICIKICNMNIRGIVGQDDRKENLRLNFSC
mgnify:CR=1 FL=1